MRKATTVMLVATLLTPLPVCGQENQPPAVSIHMAALQGNIEAVRQHIEAGADLNQKDAWGSTPLIIAAAFGRTDVAMALIEAAADLNIRNNDGATAVHTAAFLCRIEIVEALLEGGANKYLSTDLKSFGQEHLFVPLEVEPGEWTKDRDGYYIGLGELRFTPRNAAKFGLFYLNDGEYEGKQVVSADWVRESLQSYSEDINSARVESGEVGRYFRDVGYGYQWWSARAGEYHFDYAWGHGGQLIILLDDLDTVVVVTSDPFYQQHNEESWIHERANLNLVGKFIESLPKE